VRRYEPLIRRAVRLREIRSVWYRHPSHFELPEGMSRPERRHAAAEARVGVAGVLCSLNVLWVNYPSRESDALKPRQLDVAPMFLDQRAQFLGPADSALLNPVEAVEQLVAGHVNLHPFCLLGGAAEQLDHPGDPLPLGAAAHAAPGGPDGVDLLDEADGAALPARRRV